MLNVRPTTEGQVINLDGLTMFVSGTAATSVVSRQTRLHFSQRGARVVARYAGGSIVRGWLVGRWLGDTLCFRYAQREDGHTIHGGRSACDVRRLADGRIRIVENFEWSTRAGAGVNIFDEVPTSGVSDASRHSR